MRREFNYTFQALNTTNTTLRDELFPEWELSVLNVTSIVSDEFTDSWQSCLRTTWNSYIWLINYYAPYQDHDTYFPYMTSLFQGMLTNTVYLYQLNEKLTDALVEENDPAYYFWFGRILRTIMIVEPLRKDQF